MWRSRFVMMLVTLGLCSVAAPARAQITGLLELPDGFASGIANIQGWVFTSTPGAELVQPFEVRIDGDLAIEVSCCSSRGDVAASFPQAPLRTGFSAVYNWGLVATAEPASTSQATGPREILVEVLVTDTMGGSKTLSKMVELYHSSPGWPRSTRAHWKPVEGPVKAVDAECTLSNTATFTPNAAEMMCTNLIFTSPGIAKSYLCPESYFSWDSGSQSFRRTSDCGSLTMD